VIQRQLGPANLGTTSIYLEGIDSEIINTVHGRPAPVLPASAGLRQREPGGWPEPSVPPL
jgi:hypothetical protein